MARSASVLSIAFGVASSQTQSCTTNCLERIEVAATDIAASHDSVAGDAWGGQQSRIVRTSDGRVYAVYVAEQIPGALEWRVIEREPDASWSIVGRGAAGREPAHLLLGPKNELYTVAFPDTAPTLSIGRRDAAGRFTWTLERVPGSWDYGQRAYGGAGIDSTGRICVMRSQSATLVKRAGFAFACRAHGARTWTSNQLLIPERYCYDYVFPGAQGLQWVATRDVLWKELGYRRPASEPAYVLNAVGFWRFSNSDIRSTMVAEESQTPSDSIVMTFVRDAYRDTAGRLHVLYERRGTGAGPAGWAMRNAVIVADRVTVDEPLAARAPNGRTDGYYRIFQNSEGRFFWVYGFGQDIYLYRGLDSTGLRFSAPLSISVREFPVEMSGLSIAAPRGGVRPARLLDAVYPSGGRLVYVRIRL